MKYKKKKLLQSLTTVQERKGNYDTQPSRRQFHFLHTCTSHKGTQRCSLPLPYESLAVGFTHRDTAKCNPVSVGINHFAPFLGCTICLWHPTLVRRLMRGRKPNTGGQGLSELNKLCFLFLRASLFLSQQLHTLQSITHN